MASWLSCNQLDLGEIVKTLLVFLCLSFSQLVFAEDYSEQIDQFFSIFDQGRKMAAVDVLFVNDPWIASKSDFIHKVKSQLREIVKLLCNYNSSVLVDHVAIINRFVHVTYLALFDRKPARIEFQFYRAKEKWMIHSLMFDTDEELRQGAHTKIAKFITRTNRY